MKGEGFCASVPDRALSAAPTEPLRVSSASGDDPSRFERIVTFEPGYDLTNETPNRGRGSMRIRFILKGELGAVQFLIGTSWGPRSSDESTHRLIRCDAIDPCRPSGWDVGYHSPLPMYEGQSENACDLLPGGKCYYDGSGLRADEWIDDFVTGGDAWLWPKLEAEYHSLFARDSDEHRYGEDPQGLSGEAMPARADEGGIAHD